MKTQKLFEHTNRPANIFVSHYPSWLGGSSAGWLNVNPRIKNIFQTMRKVYPSLFAASSFWSFGSCCILFPPHLYLHTIVLLGETQGPHLLKGFDVSQQKTQLKNPKNPANNSTTIYKIKKEHNIRRDSCNKISYHIKHIGTCWTCLTRGLWQF